MRFIAGRYRGKNRLFVQTDNYDSRVDDPHNNHAYFKFNTDYSYFKYEGSGVFNFSFAPRYRRTVTVQNKKNTSTYYVPKLVTATQSQSAPAAVGRNTAYLVYSNDSGEPISSSFIAQRNGSAVRVLSVYGSGGYFYVREQSFLHDTDLPGLSISLYAYAFSVVDNAGTDSSKMLRIDNSKITFGGGKFDSSLPYLHEVGNNYSGVFTASPVTRSDHYIVNGTDLYGNTTSVERVGFSYRFGSTFENYGGVEYVPTVISYRVGEY